MSGPLRVWVTRAQPGADATARQLRSAGHLPLVASLLEVRALTPPVWSADGVAAVAFTSANAVRAFAGWTEERDLAAFAVGDATACAARRAGFANVRSAAGDVATLAALILDDPPCGAVLHPCARVVAGDLAGALAVAGVLVRSVPLYESVAVEALPQAAARALNDGALDAVLLHSPRAAEVLARLLGAERPASLTVLRALGLSRACTAPLAALPLAGIAAASTPDETALMALL